MLFTIMFYDISIILFTLIYGFLVLFLIIQFNKVDRIARPFIFSLILYFLFDLVGNLLEYFYNTTTKFDTNIENISLEQLEVLSFFNTIGYLLVLIGPIYLIFILEKKSFNKPIFKKYNIITILQIVLISLIIFVGIYFAIKYQDLDSIERSEKALPFIAPLYALIIAIQVMFFSGGFLYISIKSTDKYRKNTFIIAFGYIWQFLINIFYAQLVLKLHSGDFAGKIDLFFVLISLMILLRLIGLIVMSYGFLKLYYKKET
ncbi:MAG: hypothetical protein ACTSQJ_13785 [Promethearchaeota archaeon]